MMTSDNEIVLGKRDGLFLTMLLRDIKESFDYTYPELIEVIRRENLISKVAEDFGLLHYYGNDSVIEMLECDLNVSFSRP
jgi:hypothetical protein